MPFTTDWIHLIYALILLFLGYFLARQLSLVAGRTSSKRFSRHQAMLLQRLVFYGLLLLFIVSSLQQLGFKLSVLLGAAGIVTVAVSFASQTAASNLISGIFLLFEHPFKIGDVIEVNHLNGTVESIDLLSTKIKTSANVLVRIPNETLIKSAIINFSYFPTRRNELIIAIAYHSNMDLVRALVLRLVAEEQQILSEPAAQVVVNQFTESSIELKLSFWTRTEDSSALGSQLKERIRQAFDEAGFEIPFPQISIHRA